MNSSTLRMIVPARALSTGGPGGVAARPRMRHGRRVGRTPVRPRALCGGPFLGSAAIAAGLVTKGQLRSQAWQRLFHDVYADARHAVDHTLLVRGAALLLPPGAVVTGRSAAHLYGARLASPTDPVTVASPEPWRGGRGIHPTQRQLAAGDLRVYQGVPVTTPLATGYELARVLPLDDAVVWLDALGRARALRPRQLHEHASRHRGESGWRSAQRALSLCDPRAESPPESLIRLHLTLGGVLPPVPQYHILDGGKFVARVDLAWPRLKVALEYDGQWHADAGQLGRDRRRIRQLNALGWYVYPVTSADLHEMPRLVAQVHALLATR